MRALLLLLLSSTVASADPVAELVKAGAAQGQIYLDFRGPQQDGSCKAEAFSLNQKDAEWHLVGDGSDGVFRLRHWPEEGPLHLTHNPSAGGFTVMEPKTLGIPGVAVFLPALKCPRDATTESDCTPVAERLKGLTHMVSLMPFCG